MDQPNAGPGVPRPEYPRPQFVRTRWLNLNGDWQFAFDDRNEGLDSAWRFGLPESHRHAIIVPFPYQAPLSGINDQGIHEILWYSRLFEIPPDWAAMNVLLHFGAVDYECTVWVNGEEVGHNRGGHTPFQFNIAPYLNRSGPNHLTLRVIDSQSPAQPRGKQSMTGLPHDIDYFCSSGIWQTVWLEPVPPIRVESLRMRYHGPEQALGLIVYLHAPCRSWGVIAEVLEGGQRIAQTVSDRSAATVEFRIRIPEPRLWSTDNPHLYEIRVQLCDGNAILDEVWSYTGLRFIEARDGFFYLNGEKTYLRMILDQGYWPESYLAAPSDEALRSDVEWVKQFGFNGVRKHQKIEDPRWLYWCDRLGVLVWGEMPNAREWSGQAEERLISEWRRSVARDYNHPSVIAWAPINESMGFPGLKHSHPAQHSFIEQMVSITREIDPDRLVIDNDGWEHSDITDICAIHDYTPTAMLLRERYHETSRGGALPAHVWIDDKPLFILGSSYRGQPVVLSEVGGFLEIPESVDPSDRDMLFRFYGNCEDRKELLVRYRDLMEGIASLHFVAGFCYTQLTDIEQETNGLLTYDRKPKLEPALLKEIHLGLFQLKPQNVGPKKSAV